MSVGCAPTTHAIDPVPFASERPFEASGTSSQGLSAMHLFKWRHTSPYFRVSLDLRGIALFHCYSGNVWLDVYSMGFSLANQFLQV